jgi:hypothetical protein
VPKTLQRLGLSKAVTKPGGYFRPNFAGGTQINGTQTRFGMRYAFAERQLTSYERPNKRAVIFETFFAMRTLPTAAQTETMT